MLNGLDLFAGYGGAARALRPWVRTVAYCEIEKYCHGILLSEMRRGRIDRAPIWDDVRTLRKEHIRMPIDIITGGFPCQDLSVAGNRAGLEGERSGLFFEVTRLIREFRPRFVFLENVPGLLVRDMGRVAAELAALRYVGRYGVLSAYDMGAPHSRERVWIAAYSCDGGHRSSIQQVRKRWCKESDDSWSYGKVRSISDADQAGLQELNWIGHGKAHGNAGASSIQSEWNSWPVEPCLCGVANGVAYRCDRIRALGNGWVPATAREAFKRLIGIKEQIK